MKKLLLFLIVLLPTVASSQQSLSLPGVNNLRLDVKNIKSIRSLDDVKDRFDGSILLYDDWQPAVITMKTGKEEHKMMNYFIYDNSLIYMQGRDSILTLALTDRIKDIRIGNQIFEMVTYTDPKSEVIKTGVFEVVYKAEPMSIVKKYNMEMKEGQDESGYKEARKPTIVAKTALYYQPIGTTFSYPVPAKKKEFYSIFGDKAKEVETYAKTNKLKINEAGIIKMAKYYNSLK